MEKTIKCPKCEGKMHEGIGLTPRGGFLFWGKTILDATMLGYLTSWLKGGGPSVNSRSKIKVYKCQECGYLEGYA